MKRKYIFQPRKIFGRNDAVILDVFNKDLETGDIYYITNSTFNKIEPGTAPISKGWQLTNEEVQQLIDELWILGYRPSEGAGSAGALKAVQDHLKDMRRIVFHKLNIKK